MGETKLYNAELPRAHKDAERNGDASGRRVEWSVRYSEKEHDHGQ